MHDVAMMLGNPFRSPETSLTGRVLTGEEFKRRWDALDKTEQQWVMEAAARGRHEPTPQARALIAGYAWRELNRMPWVWTAFVVGVVLFAIVLTFANAPIAALVVIAGMPAVQMFHLRRLAAALAHNVSAPE
jgi:hypothetical protein